MLWQKTNGFKEQLRIWTHKAISSIMYLKGEIMGKWGEGKVLRKCNHCIKEFFSRRDKLGKYCSKSCASKNKNQINHRLEVICMHCGTSFSVKRYRKETVKYCSRKCLSIVRGRYMKGENHPKWNGGITKRPYESRAKIERIKKEIGKCENCKSTQNLEGHHIKGFKNDDNSIKILCSQCHAKEHPELKNFIMRKYG